MIKSNRHYSSVAISMLVVFVCGVLTSGRIFAANSDSTAQIPLIPPVWKDVAFLANQPDFYLVLSGLTASPAIFDRGFQTEEVELNEHWGNSAFANQFFAPGKIIGNAAVPAAGSLVLNVTGKLIHSQKMQLFGSNLFLVQAVNGLVTGAMKLAINRTRPNGGKYSYPSGHSSVAFSTAAVVTNQFGWKIGIPAFVVASYVGISRMQENKHYLSDVIAGGILGTYIGFRVSAHHEKAQGLSFSPSFVGHSPTLGFSLKF